MITTMCNAKIHGAIVTDANLNYKGSITIGKNLLLASGLLPYQLVHINNFSNAEHWETYVIEGLDNEICMNGPPSRLFQKGDKIVILSFNGYAQNEIKDFVHTCVYVNNENEIIKIEKNGGK